ncbi:MAG: aminodeoxychorismate synthase component I, partial [Planctomycetaceae bacterium]
QGGAAGLLSYELGGAWERVPVASLDEFSLPHLHVGFYDWVIAWDHAANRAWVISHGYPETDSTRRYERAAARLRNVRDRLTRVEVSEKHAAPMHDSTVAHHNALPLDRIAPQWPTQGMDGLISNFSRDDYLRAVEQVIEYIRAGDIFQANLSQRLLAPWTRSPIELYERLRRVNPAPFSGFFACDDWAIASASPERFVAMRDRHIETRPIKGTRKRKSGPEADLFTRDELRESEKDQAENVMIVDLLRNDLSRVCEAGSISIPHLCTVESYETVQHLVSEIRGLLKSRYDAWDLFRSVFPGGSITGAPKIRAMEIIAELEPTARGPYCGSLFYVGFDGNVDSNILIRTFTCRHGWAQFPVGGGIVAASNPAGEYEETLHKAEGMLRALR